MTITFNFIDDSTLHPSQLGPSATTQPRWQLVINGHSDDLLQAAGIVRRHAIETGDLASIRLVRVLKDATLPKDVDFAIAAFRKWTATVALPSRQARIDVMA